MPIEDAAVLWLRVLDERNPEYSECRVSDDPEMELLGRIFHINVMMPIDTVWALRRDLEAPRSKFHELQDI